MIQENVLTRKQMHIEAAVVTGAATLVSIAALHHDWCERLCRWLMRYELYEADEFVLVAFVLPPPT